MVESSALPNGCLPVRKTVKGTDPAPMNTRIAVPMTSAVNFWDVVGEFIWRLLLDTRRRSGRRIGGRAGDLPAHEWAELGDERVDGGIGIGAGRGKDDVAAGANGESEDGDEAL